jgi:hypothetical protein
MRHDSPAKWTGHIYDNQLGSLVQPVISHLTRINRYSPRRIAPSLIIATQMHFIFPSHSHEITLSSLLPNGQNANLGDGTA